MDHCEGPIRMSSLGFCASFGGMNEHMDLNMRIEHKWVFHQVLDATSWKKHQSAPMTIACH